MRSVLKLECSRDFRERNFAFANYLDDQKKPRPFFNMTRDGFMFLVMGFTGKEAAGWKEKFITAFNFYERKFLQTKSLQASDPWKETRAESKIVRRELTDVLKQFVDYSTAQDSKNAERYYSSITTMVYRSLFNFKDEVRIPKRDRLIPRQLRHLISGEDVVASAIEQGMSDELPYKVIYQLAKDRLETFSGFHPKTDVIEFEKPSSQLSLF